MIRALAALVLLATAPADLQGLRHEAEVSSSEAVQARQDAETIFAQRDKAAGQLAGLKEQVKAGNGGLFGDWRISRKSAEVRALVDRAAAADAAAKAKENAAAEARAELRDALFVAASDDTSAADTASRAGKRDEALRLDREAASYLAEASKLVPPEEDADPWRNYSEIPLNGSEGPTERAAYAAVYREKADDIQKKDAALEALLASTESAVAAWDRLSRFQGILDRYPTADPTPRRDRLALQVQRGKDLEAHFRELADELTGTQARHGGTP